MAFYRAHVLITMDSQSVLMGAHTVKGKLQRRIEELGLQDEVKVIDTGNLGLTGMGVVLVVYPEGVYYVNVTPKDAELIAEEHLLKGRVVKGLLYEAKVPPEVATLWRRKAAERVVLKNCGVINPDSVEEYIAQDGYEALGRALTEMTPEEVVEVVKGSGLRGRGGAGFPTGLKWSFTLPIKEEEKYMICNADEGEPGTFKDRLILEGDPHRIIEGMTIAAYAIGAHKGYIYIRGEYTLSIRRLMQSLEQAREMGFLGRDVFDSGFDFDIEIRTGAGAYICGEETALIESIEGHRGYPRFRPPFPGVVGLWGKPTVVNNVETLANVPPIILKGPEWFKSLGNERCSGTKVYTMLGHINNAGLIEVPMGITLREVIADYGGGMREGKGFKLAQTGGTAGGCVSQELLDVPMDYDSMAEAGTSLGSGALLIMDETTCVVDMVKSFVKFFRHESCGQCTPCREGTHRLYELMDKISQGKGGQEAIDLLEETAQVMAETSLCALGQSPMVSISTSLRFFRDEYLAHAIEGRCPTGVCRMGE
ncbi:MAG: NADH-quinone oxidoreductase subunit NuoF [Deltaproteobacteria bacterium]|nr:NADH-quinone oxidoreductase subunit NuoF [Deltaproteobacteria bacterium]